MRFHNRQKITFLFSLPELTDTGGWPGGGSVVLGSPPFENQSLQTFQVYVCKFSFVVLSFQRLVALQRHKTENLKQIFPEMKLRGLSPNSYIYVSVSDS
jgi:hypothetical protein